jgi:hypothetical protein
MNQKGCRYCTGGDPICPANMDELGIELHSGSGYLIGYGKDKNGWDISVSVSINYCPICGTPLAKNLDKVIDPRD